MNLFGNQKGSSSDHRGQSKRRPVILVVRAAITVGVLTALLVWLDTAELLSAVRAAGISLWALIVGLHALAHLGQAWKWRLLITAAGNSAGIRETMRAYGAGLCANTCLPSIIGGDVVRMGIVGRGKNDAVAAIAGGVADRLTDVAALILLSGLGIIMLPAVQIGGNIRVAMLASVGLFLAVVIAALVFTSFNFRRFPARISSVLSGIQEAMSAMRRRKLAFVLALAIAILMQAFLVLQNVLLGNAMGIDVSVGVWLAIWPLSKLIALVPVSLGGLGVRQAVLAALLLPFSVAPPLSVAQSLVWQTVIYAVGLMGGLMWLWGGHSRGREPNVVAGESHVL